MEGVHIRPLRQIRDDRGMVMHMLRSDDPHFERFGEIYFSTVHPGVVKGWHLHREMTLNYAVVHGEIRLVLFDDREGSSTRGEVQEIVLNAEDQYRLVTVPPGIWNGFIGEGSDDAIVANCATVAHHPDEIVRIDPRDPLVPYQWDEGAG